MITEEDEEEEEESADVVHQPAFPLPKKPTPQVWYPYSLLKFGLNLHNREYLYFIKPAYTLTGQRRSLHVENRSHKDK